MRKSVLIVAAIMLLFSVCACGGDDDNYDIRTDISSTDVSFIMDSLCIGADDAARMCVLLRYSGFDSEIKYISRENDTETGEGYYRVRADGEKYDVYYYADGSVKIKTGDEVYTYAGDVGFVTVDIDNVDEESAGDTDGIADTTDTNGATDTADTTDISDTVDTAGMIKMIVNVSSNKFHYPDCRGVATMSEKNKKTVYVSKLDELYGMGYESCGICVGE